jgi:hypothetical protein
VFEYSWDRIIGKHWREKHINVEEVNNNKDEEKYTKELITKNYLTQYLTCLFPKYDILIQITTKFQNTLYYCVHVVLHTPWQNVILDFNSSCKTYGFFVTSLENNRSTMYTLPGGRWQDHMRGLCMQHGHLPSGVGEQWGHCWGHHKQADFA